MTNKPKIEDISDIKNYLSYNPETGIFMWFKKYGTTNKLNIPLMNQNSKGYHLIYFKGKSYLAHRIAWYYVYGELPSNYIDHIDGNKLNNKINNLREITFRKNTHNKKRHREGKLLGCYYSKINKNWVSQLYFKGKTYHLGVFKTELEAHKRYLEEYNKLFKD